MDDVGGPNRDSSINSQGMPSNHSNKAIGDVEKGQAVHAQDKTFVEFDGPKDSGNPKNWSQKRRWAITASMGSLVFTVTFASSIFSVNIGVVREKFDVSIVTATLGVALFVLVSSHMAHINTISLVHDT
jgi:hypothetical protein